MANRQRAVFNYIDPGEIFNSALVFLRFYILSSRIFSSAGFKE